MFICKIWLFVWYFPQFCKSDMSKYGYLEVFQRVPSTSRKRESTVPVFEITRFNTTSIGLILFPLPESPSVFTHAKISTAASIKELKIVHKNICLNTITAYSKARNLSQ